jgi:hypothetical protein
VRERERDIERERHTKTLSKADGLPPLWTCPSTVILVSCCRFSTTTCLTFSAVMGSPSRSIAPSATMMILSRCPVERSCFIQPSQKGGQGMWSRKETTAELRKPFNNKKP